MAANINRVGSSGTLTRDPEVRQTPSGTSVCSLAHRGQQPAARRERPVDRQAELLHVSVFGNQAESCAQYLAKGRPRRRRRPPRLARVADAGRPKREAVEIVAESVQFLGSARRRGDSGGGNQFVPAGASSGGDADFQGADDDIPF